MREELIKLYEVTVQQNIILAKLEQGDYSSGIKNLNIPLKERDKTKMPSHHTNPE